MPFVFDMSSPAATGAAGVLAGQSEGAWKQLDYANQQSQQNRQYGLQQQQAALQQAEFARQSQQQQAQLALQQQQASQAEDQRAFERQMQSNQQNIDIQWKQAQLRAANQRGAEATQRADLTNQSREQVATIGADGRMATNAADNTTRLTIAKQNSDNFLKRVGQQNDQFLSTFGLNRQKLTDLQAYRQTTTSQAARNAIARYDVEMANAQNDRDRLALTARHYSDLNQLKRQEDADKLAGNAAAAQDRANQFNAGQQNDVSQKEFDSLDTEFRSLELKVNKDKNDRARLQQLSGMLYNVDGSPKKTKLTTPATVAPTPRPQFEQLARPNGTPVLRDPPTAPAPASMNYNETSRMAQAPPTMQAIADKTYTRQELTDTELSWLVQNYGPKGARDLLNRSGYDYYGKPKK